MAIPDSKGSVARLLHTEVAGNIPVVTVTGTPRSVGTFIGGRLESRLHVLVQDTLSEIHRYTPGTKRSVSQQNSEVMRFVHERLGRSCETLRNEDPHLWMELESTAQAASLDIEHLMAVHALSELITCLAPDSSPFVSNSISLTPEHSQEGTPLLAMSWHMPASLAPHLMLVRRIPNHGPATLSLSLTGLHTVAGINEAGMAVCSDNLIESRQDLAGVPVTTMIDSMLCAPTWDEALHRLRNKPPLGSRAVHILNSSGQRRSIELGPGQMAELMDRNADAPRVHTNHSLSRPGAFEEDPLPPPISYSRRRLKHLANRACSARRLSLGKIDEWFAQRTHESRLFGDDPQSAPIFACTLIFDPFNNRIHCHRGASPQRLDLVTL